MNHFRDRDILVENRDFTHPPAFDAFLGGSRRNIAIMYGIEKLVCYILVVCYAVVEKVW